MNTIAVKLSSMLASILLVALAQPAAAQSFIGFSAGPSFSLVGSADSPTVPSPLLILFDAPVAYDSFISITSGNPLVLTVTSGGVTIPAGQASASVNVSGLRLGSSLLTANFGPFSSTAAVNVVASIPSVPAPPALWLMASGLAFLGIAFRRASASWVA